MKKTMPVIVALVGLFVVLGIAPAQAYPDTTPTVQLTAHPSVVVGGNPFTAKATADTNCVWKLSYLKQTASGTGTSITHTFSTPVVKKRTDTTVTATCGYDANGSNRAVAGSAPSTVTRTATVTLLPRKGGTGHAQHGQDHGTGGKGHHGNGGNGHAHHGQDHGVPGNPNTGGQSPAGHSQAGPSHGGGLLPNTGGFGWWLLVLAALLVGGGATAVVRGRGDRAER